MAKRKVMLLCFLSLLILFPACSSSDQTFKEEQNIVNHGVTTDTQEALDPTMAYDDKPIIWDIDLDIIEGTRTAIIGPNGAGKSTLLRGILGLQKTLSGRISLKVNL